MKLSTDTQNTSNVSSFRINRGSANLEKNKRGGENVENPRFILNNRLLILQFPK